MDDVDTKAAERKALAVALIARRRGENSQKLGEQRAAEASTTERHSGIRIVERRMRPEKWDLCMRGKQLFPIGNIGSIQRGGSQDQVIIGVVCAAPQIRSEGLHNEKMAEFRITDVAKEAALSATIVLTGNALNLLLPDASAPLRVGLVVGVLNPVPTGRASTVRVTSEKQVAALGHCPALRICCALGVNGRPCGAPYNAEVNSGCPAHGASAVPCSAPLRTTGSENAARAIAVQPSPCRAGLGSCLVAMEAAAARLHGAVVDAELLAALMELEDIKVDARLLRLVPVYGKVGDLVCKDGEVGLAAKRLRRKWRALLDSVDGAACAELSSPSMPPSFKRRRV